METLTVSSTQTKPIHYGSGFIIKELDDKILITAQCRTRLKEGNFLLDAEHINVETGAGVRVSSRGKDTLVISCDLTKIEEKIFDMQQEMDKRLKVIEQVFSKILKQVRQ